MPALPGHADAAAQPATAGGALLTAGGALRGLERPLVCLPRVHRAHAIWTRGVHGAPLACLLLDRLHLGMCRRHTHIRS